MQGDQGGQGALAREEVVVSSRYEDNYPNICLTHTSILVFSRSTSIQRKEMWRVEEVEEEPPASSFLSSVGIHFLIQSPEHHYTIAPFHHFTINCNLISP